MTQDDYRAFRDFLERACGIVLGDDKHYLVESRLGSLMARHAIPTLGQLVERLKRDTRSGLYDQIIDAMTTNETQWFRDGFPFEILKSAILPALVRGRRVPVRIWSAACSSGQEPYSLSIAVEEFARANPGLALPDIQVVATDISPTMLELAAAGSYDGLAIARGLSPERQRLHFSQQNGRWTVKDALRRRVSFRELNLTHGYEPLGRFDVVFCRNVLIYFSPDLKRDILARIAATLSPRGYLVLGAAESLAGYSEAFEMLRLPEGIVYQLRGAAPARR